MKLDNALNDLINELTQDTDNLWTDARGYVKLADLVADNTHSVLTVRPRRRTYLKQSDAGYDWACGREFIITTRTSPYYGEVVAVDEANHLKNYGYTHVHIHYNNQSAPLEIEL